MPSAPTASTAPSPPTPMSRRGRAPAEMAAWLGTFVVTIVVCRDAFRGGSLFALAPTAAAAGVASFAVVCLRSRYPRAEGDEQGPRTGVLKALAGLATAVVAALAAVITAMFATVSATGCFMHCDPGDVSLTAAAIGAGATAVLVGASGWSAAWALGASSRTQRITAGVGGGLTALAMLSLVGWLT